jgi:hypothetical protein
MHFSSFARFVELRASRPPLTLSPTVMLFAPRSAANEGGSPREPYSPAGWRAT